MVTDHSLRPRRSVLYMPAINARAMSKATQLDADALVFDLEDAVAPAQKQEAREQLATQLSANDYGHRERIVRVNAVDTPWFADDVEAVARLDIEGVALPKVESAAQLQQLADALQAAGAPALPLWPMIETPRGVQQVEAIAAAGLPLACLVMGTSDLAKELQLGESEQRLGLQYALSRCVLAARAQGLDVLDGVCLAIKDGEQLERDVRQGVALGFTGKTLIHPSQLAISNALFGVSQAQAEQAQRVIDASLQAEREGSGVAVLDGKLVESLHVVQAQRVLALFAAISARGY